jgi:Uma2 family endonuclease
MAKASRSVRLTYQDLVDLPDDGLRYELIDGELHVTAAPSPKHQRVSGNIHLHVALYLRDHPIGRVYYAPLDVVLSRFDSVEPDLLYVSHEREARQMTRRNLEGPPDLVIEVLSPSTKRIDQDIKLSLYERYGVPEYWVMNPERELVRVYRLKDGCLLFCEELHNREDTSVAILTTPLMPGLAIPLADIFA